MRGKGRGMEEEVVEVVKGVFKKVSACVVGKEGGGSKGKEGEQ